MKEGLFVSMFQILQKRISIRGILYAPKMYIEEDGIQSGNSKQKTKIPGAPVGCAVHARLITILFDDSPPL